MNPENAIQQTVLETVQYDEAGRKARVTNGNAETTRYRYDRMGNVVLSGQETVNGAGGETAPLAYAMRYRYDALCRKIGQTDAMGMTQAWSYDFSGRMVGRTDSQSNGGAPVDFNFHYNFAGQLVHEDNTRVEPGVGGAAAGNLKGVRQEADGQATTTTYQYTYLNGSWQQSAALTRRGGDVVGTITQRDANGFVVGIRQPKATGSAAQAPDGSLAAALTNQATQPTSNDARYDRTFVNDASGTTVFVSQGGFNAQGEVNSSIANPASGYQGGVTGSSLTPGHVQRQLVANGEVLARYGDAPT